MEFGERPPILIAVEEVDPVATTTRADPVADALTGCASGDQSAMATLYDLTSTKVYGLALRVLRNPAHAEEVAQESYLDAWQRSAGFDATRGSGLAWLLTITHRRAVDRVRAAQAASRRDTTYGLEDLATTPADPADIAIASVEAARVRGALHDLTQLQREAVELAYFGGRTHREVADALDVPLGTVKTRIRDGLTRLRSALGGD
ncbi:MAG: ECF RNA polymerase sigma factor SigK [Micropruina sp.]|nr:ECF RNA polymerase sigma factor SigK [Micropruina sp.]